jgi:uracil-DNA glycosylase family 4
MTPDAHPSLQLDARQRGMLQAMGLTVWQPPEPLRAAAPAPAPQRPLPAVSSTFVRPDIAHLRWGALQQAVQDCRACGLCTHRQHTVFGAGSPSGDAQTAPGVDWLVVGEAPGEQEDRAGEPFVGPAGQLLDNMLSALGLSRRSAQGGGVYIVNTLKCRPPANRNPSPDELLQCAPFLERQIALLQPRVIVAMGRYAAQSLLQQQLPDVEKMPLGKLRGQAHTHQGIPVVVTYHPAYLLRNLPEKAKAWEDLVLARQLLLRLKSTP